MNINLNNQNELSIQSVQNLIASGNDDTNSQLRVSANGEAYLSKIVGNIDIDGLAFRLETWIAGNGYVGPQAAQNPEWVTRVYDCLKKNWPNPKNTFIDFF